MHLKEGLGMKTRAVLENLDCVHQAAPASQWKHFPQSFASQCKYISSFLMSWTGQSLLCCLKKSDGSVPFAVHPGALSPADQCNVWGWGVGLWWWTKSPLLIPPILPPSSHFMCEVILLSCRQVAVGADCGAVVLVTGGHEGQGVRVDLVAGGTVRLGCFLLSLAQLAAPQSLQHLGADLGTNTHRFSYHGTHCGPTPSQWSNDSPGCFFQTEARPELLRSHRPFYQRMAPGRPSS